MRAIFGGKATDELNKTISPKKQNRILFILMLLLIVSGTIYIISFYL